MVKVHSNPFFIHKSLDTAKTSPRASIAPCKKAPIALPRAMFTATPVAPNAMSNAGNSLNPLLILRIVYP
jgi:hypothetical protein